MRLVIVSGSHRVESQSGRISKVLADRVKELSLVSDVDILSLSGNPLPLWDESIYSGSEEWKQLLAPWKKTLREADALIVVSPEWNGMVPSGLKNFFHVFGTAELGHKPGLIVTVSSGLGGSYPVAELRMSSYKNNRICFLPEHLIVRNVEEVLTGQDVAADDALRLRMDYCLSLLKEYATGLGMVRVSGVVNHKAFRNGM